MRSSKDANFERFRPEIEQAIDKRFYTMDWLEDEIASGRVALLSNDTAIIGVERRHYPSGAIELHGTFAAGDIDGILELVDMAMIAAKQAGCTIATISSRVGWYKVLKSRGFEVRQQVITRELT